MSAMIDVAASRSYRVEIGPGMLPLAGERVKTLFPKAERVVIVSDDAVFPLHGKPVLDSLQAAGVSADTYIIPHGEASKTAATLLELLNFLPGAGLTRTDALLALGGGVVGDMTGLAAAVYQRGIGYIQCPTTLLAAVDSSVGGKTAVDLPAGKNLMGAFWQPRAVLCDTEVLDTLPPDIFADGCAEVVKTAILFDPDLFETLNGPDFDREAVIARCVRHKRDIVAEDEFDTGRRGLLNLGHTLGHGIEAASDFSVSHGQAVAMGTCVVTRAAAKNGIADPSLPGQVEARFRAFGLPTQTDRDLRELMPYLLKDKKRSGGLVKLIVPKALGDCVQIPLDREALYSFLKAGM